MEGDEQQLWSTWAAEIAGFVFLCVFPLHRSGAFAFSLLLPTTPAKSLFAMSFALSLSLLILILLEVLGVLATSSRAFLWRVILGLDLVLLVAILPYAQISSLLQHTPMFPARFAPQLALAPMLLWLWLFYKIGQPFPLLQRESFWYLQSLCLSRAGMIGVSVTAAMSGVGAVNGPASSLSRLLHTVSKEELHAAERRLQTAFHALLQHRARMRELLQLQTALEHHDAQAREVPSNDVSIATRLQRLVLTIVPLSWRSRSYRHMAADVQNSRREEYALVTDLHRQLWVVTDLMAEQERLQFAMTWKGRIYNFLGYVFSVYCVFKMWTAGRSILGKHAKLGEDAVTRGLRIALRLVHMSDVDVSMWSQAISLALVGVMIFSSVRGFLVQAYRLRLRSKASSHPALDGRSVHQRDRAVGADLVGYATAHVMGFYFLSSVLLTRASLPHQFRTGISQAVGTNLEYAFYHHWFDSIFLAAACITFACCFWKRVEVQRRRKGSNPEATLLALRRVHHAVQASARRQELVDRERQSPFAIRASSNLTSAPRGVQPPSLLRNRKDNVKSGEWAKQQSQFREEAAWQDSTSAMIAGASAAAARGPAALIEYVTVHIEATDTAGTTDPGMQSRKWY